MMGRIFLSIFSIIILLIGFHFIFQHQYQFLVLFIVFIAVVFILILLWVGFIPLLTQLNSLLNKFNIYPDSFFSLIESIKQLEKKLDRIKKQEDNIPFIIAENIRKQEYIDQASGLGNRRFFDARMDELLLTANHSGQGAVILLAITSFQKINKKLMDENKKNEIISEIAVLLQNIFKDQQNIVLSKRNEYSFAIMLHPIIINQIKKWVNKIHQALKLIPLNEKVFFYHMGISTFLPGEKRFNVLSTADLALRTSELKGFNNSTIMHEEQKLTLGMVQWRTLLENVIRTKSIDILVQPLMNFSGENIIHSEIFTRLKDRDGNEIFADEFLPMAYASGNLEALERLIFDQVLKLMLQDENFEQKFAVNLSQTSLSLKGFLHWLIKRISSNTHLVERLSIEIREKPHFEENSIIFKQLEQLKETGVKIGIDHVGEHLSDLVYLQNPVFDYVKIHHSVVLQLSSEDSLSSELFVKSLSEIAAQQGFQLYAEGIENEIQTNILNALNVHCGQGYFLSKPKPLQSR